MAALPAQQDLTSLPLTVNFSASLGSTSQSGLPAPLPASASDTFSPVNLSVTFPANVTTETVHIPINSGAANPGSVPVQLSATSSTPNVDSATWMFFLVSGPSALPPTPLTITNYHFNMNGKKISNLAITFSQPMSRASVENVHNYLLNSGHSAISRKTVAHGSIAVKSAQFDPVTNTVTLIPGKRLKASGNYTVEIPPTRSRPRRRRPGRLLHRGWSAKHRAYPVQSQGSSISRLAAPVPATISSGD